VKNNNCYHIKTVHWYSVDISILIVSTDLHLYRVHILVVTAVRVGKKSRFKKGKKI